MGRLGLPLIARIAPHLLFIAMQKIGKHVYV
jgi:hypothetical protein